MCVCVCLHVLPIELDAQNSRTWAWFCLRLKHIYVMPIIQQIYRSLGQISRDGILVTCGSYGQAQYLVPLEWLGMADPTALGLE